MQKPKQVAQARPGPAIFLPDPALFTGRVTRLGDFSSFGGFFTWAAFINCRSRPNFFPTVNVTYICMYALILTRKWVGEHFGQFIHTHMVTVLAVYARKKPQLKGQNVLR
jgi:hypothetical protein